MQPNEQERIQRLEKLHDLFQTEGWSIFSEIMGDCREPLLNIRNVKDENDMFFRKGKVHAFDEVLGLPEMVRAELNSQDEANVI